MKKKIAIIGAGIAGLTLANLIKKNSDFEFTVYEKEESLPLDDGFGIQLATNSVSILNKIDFQKVNPKDIFHPKAIDFFTIKNEKICDLEISKFNSEYSKYTTL
ncbi:NAD(P)-binding protein, partial [Pelagibacterales bacterium SAG-MED29]|nr:NAD(P)-binding protein [Pelagibacterales bacterium SAG-MED29]